MPANDDRPWGKKNRDESDDDDDRPRRKRRDESDEGADEERPRKRPRDDEEEEDRPRRRPRDDDEYDHDRPARRAQASNGLATAGLILGVLALCTGPLAGIPAVICSLLAMGKPTGRGMAIGGLLLGGLGTLLGAVAAYLMFTGGLEAFRHSAGRQKDANNLKQIGLAFHNYHDSTGRMVAPFAQDPRGQANRDLSFRVALLPYIEQNNLAMQFDMTQPWDSPKNRTPSNTAIRTYTSPYSGEVASTQTPYRVFYGGGAIFDEKGGPVRFTDVSDGLSNTILLVHAVEQVPWAQPKELLYNPTGPLPQLWAKDIPGTNVVMADGSVRFVRKTVSESTLRGAITRSGGERMGTDW